MRKFGVNPGTTKTSTEQHAIADSREKDTPTATKPPPPLPHTIGVGPQRAMETWTRSLRRAAGGGQVGGNTGGEGLDLMGGRAKRYWYPVVE